MALALLLQQRAAKNAKPGKGENFGCKFKAIFVLESTTVRPYGKLSGQLVIESPAPILHYGIRIQFEALCNLKFESKLDSRVRTHSKYGSILEGQHEKEMVDGYIESPVMIDLEPVIKGDLSDVRAYELQAGTNTYGFNIGIPGHNLPCPFKNSYGSLLYKLVAYMRSENGPLVHIGEKNLKFGGYFNLSENPHCDNPLTIERSVKRSMFTGRKLATVKLELDTSGYLPEEMLRFTMNVHNPKVLPLKMSIQLLQKVTYAVNKSKKSTAAVVGSADKDVTEPELDLVWEGCFKLHKLAYPTYAGKNPMYTVSHVVQFKVKLDDHNVIKAEKPVFIGTTRDTVDSLIASANNLSVSDVSVTDSNRVRERRGSSTSTCSTTTAAATTVSKPPPYGQMRMPSTETLPPGFDDVTIDEDKIQPTIPEDEPSASEPPNESESVKVDDIWKGEEESKDPETS